MKKNLTFTLLACSVIALLTLGVASRPAQFVYAQVEMRPDPAGLAQSAARPLLVVQSYATNEDYIYPGQEFSLRIKLHNAGSEAASNVVATFTAGEVVPRQTGGMIAVPSIAAGDNKTINQPMTATWDVWGKTVASITLTLTYTGPDATIYTDTFTITLRVYTPSGPFATATPTPTLTAAPVLRPQLVISSYTTDVMQLQPGSQFTVQFQVDNVGNANASRITMIVGGGSASPGGGAGTPEPGGTSGGSGEFTNFAPLGASNIQSLGDLDMGATLNASQTLIVNVTTQPGAYSMKIAFSYLDERGRTFTDDQVITLLVYSVPKVDVDFYMPVGDMMAGQPNMLPLQVVNLGKNSAVLGNLRVQADGAELMNNVALIGNLEPGGYFPVDATLIPSMPGPLDLRITVDYTDDFNQQKQIEKVITVNVMEMPIIEPEPGTDGNVGPDGEAPVEPVPSTNETFWQKVVRFFRGLLGLDSGQTTPEGPVFDGGVAPEGEMPVPQQEVPAQPLKGP